MYPKALAKLTFDEIRSHSVWEFDLEKEGSDGPDETWIFPVDALPVDSLANRFVSSQVTLANGSQLWAVISNIDALNPRRTDTFAKLTIITSSDRFHLARYFDPDYLRCGPDALAEWLGMAVLDVSQ